MNPSRRTWLIAVLVAVVGGAAIGTVIALSGSGAASGPRHVTAVARRGDVSETVSTPFTLTFGSTATLALPNAATVVPTAGIVAGVGPANQAAALEPASALRYE
jgi:hypothetical protein